MSSIYFYCRSSFLLKILTFEYLSCKTVSQDEIVKRVIKFYFNDCTPNHYIPVLKCYPLKGTMSLFWPMGPEIALTFLRNELIVKLQNSQMEASYGRNGENFWYFLSDWVLLKWPGFFLEWPGFFLKWRVTFLKWPSLKIKIRYH